MTRFHLLSYALACTSLLCLASCGEDDGTLPDISLAPLIISDDIETDRTLTNVHDDAGLVDYLVTDLDWRIEAGLIIEPGVRIAFVAGARMYVDERGYLIADGDPSQQANLSVKSIIFEGEARNPGHWRGIVVYSPDSRNLLNEVLIAHTGSSAVGISDLVAALSVERVSDIGGQLAIVNTHITDGLGYGLLVPDGNATRKPGILRTLRGLQVSNMGLAAMRLDPVAATKIDQMRGLSGNGFNGVEIAGMRVNDVQNLVWPAIAGDYPYRIMENLVLFGGLKLSPGVRVEMAAGTGIRVDRTGTFNAEGRADAPITIVGAVPAAGHWRGIAFFSSNINNKIAHSTISHGGGEAVNSSVNPSLLGLASVTGTTAYLSLSDVRLTDSGACGISNGKSGVNMGTLEMSRVTFSNIAGSEQCGS